MRLELTKWDVLSRKSRVSPQIRVRTIGIPKRSRGSVLAACRRGRIAGLLRPDYATARTGTCLDAGRRSAVHTELVGLCIVIVMAAVDLTGRVASSFFGLEA